MGLSFSGKQADTDTGVSLEAFDGDKRVVVKASSEAIQDYGLSAVRQCASEKYDAGDLADGFVQVWTDDLKKKHGVGGLPIDD
jgi:hypothetical protein